MMCVYVMRAPAALISDGVIIGEHLDDGSVDRLVTRLPVNDHALRKITMTQCL